MWELMANHLATYRSGNRKIKDHVDDGPVRPTYSTRCRLSPRFARVATTACNIPAMP